MKLLENTLQLLVKSIKQTFKKINTIAIHHAGVDAWLDVSIIVSQLISRRGMYSKVNITQSMIISYAIFG